MTNDMLNLKELEGLSEEERKYALEILKEYSDKGHSEKLNQIVYSEYKEIPVDIVTFIHDKEYLGNALTDPDGRFTIFPYWEEKLKEIFPTNTTTSYNTIILTGAIGLGKSTIAVICLLYMLYRLLCLKDPYLHYGLQPIDKITISLMNITIENATGVALDKMNQMILASSWFMSHGKMVGQTNLTYTPEKHIELITASSNNQVIGRAIFCLDGDVTIRTTDGDKTLKELVDKPINVYSVDNRGDTVISNTCTVKPTIKTDEEYQIELEDGTVIKCTPNHKFMLKDGTYKEAQYLTEEDKLYSKSKCCDCGHIKSITKTILNEPKQYYDVVECTPYHNFEIVTNSGIVVSHNCNFSDEVNWGITNDTEKLKKKYKTLVSQIDARMKSRFLRGTYLPTLNIIASSKNNEQSFLDEFIKTKRDTESKNTLIVDEPQWVVDDRKNTPQKFYVAIGNRYLANELLPEDATSELVEEYRAKGYSLLQVPMGYISNFKENIDDALKDIAGIATASSTKYISGIRWNEIKTDTYKNPFTKEEIVVGTAKDDIAQYSDYFNFDSIPPQLRSLPLYVHLDMSKGSGGKGDKTGIGGVWVVGKRPKVAGESDTRELFFKVAFDVSIKAPKGYEISFDKNRAFIRWLRSKGFNIKGVSCDTYNSAQIQQQLTADGFNVSTISVDRLDNETKICLPYAYFKSTIYERRLEVYSNCPMLTEEILGLEREGDGHINHPEGGTKGCFVGETKVSLVDGRELSFFELVDEFNKGKQNFVYSFNEDKKIIEPKPIINAWCTRRNASLVEVELDNGEVLKCTPNHKFMLRSGIYKEAIDLQPNDSLMPLYRKYPTEVVSMKNYRMYYEPIEDGWHYEHRRFAKEILDERYLVHHKDCNKDNNSPTNLIWCSKAEHQRIHKQISSGVHSESALKKKRESLLKWHKENKDTDAYKSRNRKLHIAGLKQHNKSEEDYLLNQALLEQQKQHGIEIREQAERNRQAKINRIKKIESLFGVNWESLTANERDGYAVKLQRIEHPETTKAVIEAVVSNHKAGKYTNAYKALAACNEESRILKELIPTVDKELFKQIFGVEYDSLSRGHKASYTVKYRKILAKTALNHKVVKVRCIEEVADVYDITVEDNHNFALSCGIFVHNSKDISDSICGSLWNASQHAEEYAFDYGETLSTISDVSIGSTASAKQQVSVDFENEMTKVFDPFNSQSTTNQNQTKKEFEDNQFFMDFGMGKAQVIQQQYLANGIIMPII